MIKFLTASFVCIFLHSFLFAQKMVVKVTMLNRTAAANNDTIYYSNSRKLTWADFQGSPLLNSVAGAATSSGFAFDAGMNMAGDVVNLDITIFTFFSKKNSWKKTNINSAYHLEHEQHHYDITHLSAQKFYNDLLQANFTFKNYNNLVTSIFNRDFEENNQLQDKYDKETNHSIDSIAQLQWNERIRKQVAALQ